MGYSRIPFTGLKNSYFTQASEWLDPGLFQRDEAWQVVRSYLPVLVQPYACCANEVPCLANHLCPARQQMFDAGTHSGAAIIAPPLGPRDRLVLNAFALEVYVPGLFPQPHFALAIDKTFVSQDVPIRVGGIGFILEMRGVALACRADLDFA